MRDSAPAAVASAGGDDHADVYFQHAVAERGHPGTVCRHDQGAACLTYEFVEQFEYALGRLVVEIAGRFIGEQ